jgi:hypothetical protein
LDKKKKNTEEYKLKLQKLNKERNTNVKLKDNVMYIDNRTKITHICTCGKEWDVSPSNILTNTKSCGLCITFEDWCLSNNKKDVLDRWDYGLNDKSPSEINYGTKKKYYFKCPKELHDSELKRIYDFTSRCERNVKCNKCNSFKQWCIDNKRRDVLDRWDYKLNDCKPDEIFFSTKKKYYFKCSKNIHESELKNISNFTSGQEGSIKCNQCNSFAQWGIDNLGKDFLEKYWDYEKNIVDPWEISYKSKIYIYMKCQEKKYHDSYKIQCRDFTNGSRCSYCKGDKIVYSKDSFAQYLIDTYGENALKLYWDYNKNKKDPYTYKIKSNKKVYIYCQEKDYHGSYPVKCSDFVRGDRCGYCHGNKVHPLDSLGKLLEDKRLLHLWSDKNKKSPYEYKPFSNENVYFKCSNNKHDDFNIIISNYVNQNFRCPDCSNEQKESIMATTLKQVLKHEYPNTKWEYDAGFRTPKNYIGRYDIFVPELNDLLIECQSEYHDNPEQQIIDKLKKEYALNNGYNYLAIDKRNYSPLQAIQIFLPNIDKVPDYVDISKNTNLNWDLKKAQELLNDGYTYQEVADMVGTTYGSLTKFIKINILIKPKDYKIKMPSKHIKIVCLSKKDNSLVSIYNSLTEAAINLGNKKYIINICKALKKLHNEAYGFKWMYYDEYIQLNNNLNT